MRLPSISLLLSISSFLVSPAFAVIKDEAYEIDWHIPVVGNSIRPSTFFHRPQIDSKASLLYTLTDRKVLAALHPRDGSLVWRQSIAEDVATAEPGTFTARPAEGKVISAGGKAVKAFDAADGRLLWATEFSQAVRDVRISKEQDAVVLCADGSVRRLDGTTGSVINEYYNIIKKEEFAHSLHLSSNATIVVSLVPNGNAHKLQTTTIFSKDKVDTLTLSDSEVVSPGAVMFVGGPGIAAWIEDQGRVLLLLSLGARPMSLINIPEGVIRIEVHPAPNTNVFLISYDTISSSWAEVWELKEEYGIFSKLFNIAPKPHSPTSWSANTASNGEAYFTLSLPFGASEIYNAVSPDPVYSFTGNSTAIPRAFLSVSEVIPRSDNTYALRTFLASYPDGNTHLTLNGNIAWTRPESLAGLKMAVWVELLDPTVEEVGGELHVEEMQNVLEAYIHRVKRHIHELITYGPTWVSKLPGRVIAEFTGAKVETVVDGVFRDGFGFRKLVVGVTANGGMVAIDVGQKGKVEWVLHHVLENRMAEVKGLYEIGKGIVGLVTGGGWYVEVDAFEGKLLNKERIEGITAVLSTSLVELEAGEKKVILVLVKDASGTEEVRYFGGHALAISKDMYITYQDSFGDIHGYKATPQSNSVEKTFSFVPPEMELVTSVIAPSRTTPPASIGKVMGDRSVMYKYLNPHMILVSTKRLDDLGTASIYLLDSVSGTVLYSATHSSVDKTKPIVSVMCENWFVYSFYTDADPTDDASATDKVKGYQVVVTELYESPIRNDRGPLQAESTFSAFDPEVIKNKPYAISQSFISPAPITYLATTSTKQSITTTDILAYLSHPAALLSIPKRILDPRRPIDRDPDATEREEGLFRYDPVLQLDHRSILSHKREFLNNGGKVKIITSPSLLESTSLVFLYSETDLFGTRVSPSGTFDILGKGFGKLQLVGTVVGLAIGVWFVAPMVRKKQISQRWMSG
ncbi:hypothetical protein BDZ91DRAFT_699208 [Kalaharituber pfeilii]|nr:hypothetical protein BDZ91DRAFT_699208 [Kalaharituber pfeilii]